MIETTCYRDLTRKTKIKGLSSTSWAILIVVGVGFWFIFVLLAIPIAIILYAVLWLLEFFDEDIYKILSIKSKVKANQFYS